MTIQFTLLISILAASLISCSSMHKQEQGLYPPRRIEFTYAQLQLRDMDEIKRLIARRMNEGDALLENDPSATDEATAHYQSAVRVLFSRPDQDGARTPIFSDIRKRLADIKTLDRTLQELADESIGALKSRDAAPVEKATYIHLLENLMSEIKPEVTTNENFKDILVQIRDAQIEIGPDLRQANLMRSMDPLASPSRTAELILNKPTSKKKPKTKR